MDAGARVVLTGRRSERLDELVAELGEENAIGAAGDIAERATITALVATALERFGRIDRSSRRQGPEPKVGFSTSMTMCSRR